MLEVPVKECQKCKEIKMVPLFVPKRNICCECRNEENRKYRQKINPKIQSRAQDTSNLWIFIKKAGWKDK
jgi:hypothetical protein